MNLIPAPPHPTNDLALIVDPDRVAIVAHRDGATRLLVPLPPGGLLKPSMYRRVLGGIMRAHPPRRVLLAVSRVAAGAPHAGSLRTVVRELQTSFGYAFVELPDIAELLDVARTPERSDEATEPRH